MKRLSLTIILSLNLLTFANPYSTAPVDGIPKVWVEQKGEDVLRYANYIKSLELEHVDPYDVIAPSFKEHDGVSNSLPPRSMWKDITPTLKVVDKLSELLDADVKPFIKAYRSPDFNRSIKGKSRSYHLKNIAVRVSYEGVTPEQVAIAAKKLRSEDFFTGGIGVYSDSIHIDTRGSIADW